MDNSKPLSTNQPGVSVDKTDDKEIRIIDVNEALGLPKELPPPPSTGTQPIVEKPPVIKDDD